jgi:hypothetical protein
MTAVVAPAIVNPGKLHSRRTAQNPYKLALFPVKILSAWNDTGYESQVIQEIDRFCNADNRLEFTDTYKRIKELPDTVMLMDDKVSGLFYLTDQ